MLVQGLGVQQYAAGEFRLYGVGSSGAIKNDYYSSGGWLSQGLGGTPAYATTAPTGVALFVDPTGVFQVFAPTSTGDLAVEQYNGSAWNEYTLGRAMAPTTLDGSVVPGQVAVEGNLTSQDLFFVGNTTGPLYSKQYSYKNNSDGSSVAIDSNAPFYSGSNFTTYTDGSTVNVFGVGEYGKATWSQFTPGRGWTGFTQLNTYIPGATVTFPAGAPLTAAAQNGMFYLFGVSSGGVVEEYSYNSSTNVWSLTAPDLSISFPNGAPLAVWAGSSTIDVFGVLADGSVEWLHASGGTWTASTVATGTGLASAAPLSVTESGSNIYLFGVNTSNEIDEIADNGGTWSVTNPDSSVTFANSAALGVQYSGGSFSLYGLNASGDVQIVSGSGTSWTSQTQGGSPAFAVGAGTTLYVDPTGVIEVFGLTSSNTLAVVKYSGTAWSEEQLA